MELTQLTRNALALRHICRALYRLAPSLTICLGADAPRSRAAVSASYQLPADTTATPRSSRAAFNSGRLAFSEPSGIYVLLLNPTAVGDEPQATVSHQARDVAKRKPKDWCAFLDDQWGNRPPGKHFLQRNLLRLYARLGVSPRNAPSSQLVFLATKTPADLKRRPDFQDLLEDCWHFHAAVIQKLQPRAIVCVGKDAADFTRRKLNANILVGERRADVGKRPRTSQSHKNAQGLTVISLPHPAAPGFGPDWTYDEIELVGHALKRPARRSDFKPIRIGGEMISDTVIAGRG